MVFINRILDVVFPIVRLVDIKDKGGLGLRFVSPLKMRCLFFIFMCFLVSPINGSYKLGGRDLEAMHLVLSCSSTFPSSMGRTSV